MWRKDKSGKLSHKAAKVDKAVALERAREPEYARLVGASGAMAEGEGEEEVSEATSPTLQRAKV